MSFILKAFLKSYTALQTVCHRFNIYAGLEVDVLPWRYVVVMDKLVT